MHAISASRSWVLPYHQVFLIFPEQEICGQHDVVYHLLGSLVVVHLGDGWLVDLQHVVQEGDEASELLSNVACLLHKIVQVVVLCQPRGTVKHTV